MRAIFKSLVLFSLASSAFASEKCRSTAMELLSEKGLQLNCLIQPETFKKTRTDIQHSQQLLLVEFKIKAKCGDSLSELRVWTEYDMLSDECSAGGVGVKSITK